jgi:hypothetical protein
LSAHPLVLEINTRCWLRELSDGAGHSVTLATAPDAALAAWQQRCLTHIWLMGAWTTGPKTSEIARAQPSLRALCGEAFGSTDGSLLDSSPYAIGDYRVAESFGGAAGLRVLRQKLRERGLGLILDFVPNHLGLDHPWLTTRPGLFVRSAAARSETFPVTVAGETSWVAHGKDPNFPAWSDTAQLDYRVPATRAAMTDVLLSIAEQCDGVRCDMAMLLLAEVFSGVWRDFPCWEPAAGGEFWAEAIATVKRKHPHFLFIAEAYWNLEGRLASLGFDYAYDKEFYDRLTRRDYSALQAHVRGGGGGFAPTRFLENHDEPRIASILSYPEQRAATALLLSQPGMRLLHDGQREGRRRRTPVQFSRYWPETPDAEATAIHDALYSALARTSIGRGEAKFLAAKSATGDGADLSGCFVIHWESSEGETLAAINMSAQQRPFRANDIRFDLAPHEFQFIAPRG